MSWKELASKLVTLSIDYNLTFYYSAKTISVTINEELLIFIHDQDKFNNKQILRLLTIIEDGKYK